MDVETLRETLREAYDDFYDDPRAIHYAQIAAQYEPDGLPETDMLADVVDMACRDARNDRDRRSTDDIVATLAEWGSVDTSEVSN